MFLANFRVAISWALKQPLYYAVKVLGLALGIMSVALLVAYVDFVGKYDAHIADREQIYRVVGEDVSRVTGERRRYDVGSNAWIEPFRTEYAGVYDSMAVLMERNGVFAHETTVFDEDYYFADQAALELFSIELVQGDAGGALTGPNKVLLSESAAVKYFGTADDAVGKTLTLDQLHYLGVSGVFRDLPKQTNFPMGVLVSYDTTERVLGDVALRNQLWILYTGHTMFVKFDDPQKAAVVSADLNAFAYRRSPEQDIPILERNQFALRLQPLTDIYLDPLTGGADGDDFTRRNTYYGMWILALLIILGACVNYVSLTIGQLQLRIKELGVRTSFGATKPALLMQLVAESLLVSCPAILLSANFLYVLVPVFAAVVAVPMEISDVMTAEVWGGGALLVLLVCAFVSAAPVLFSSQEAVRGRALRAQAARFSWRAASVVIFFQFALSTVSALMVLGIYLQVSLLQNSGAGFDVADLVVADTRLEGAAARADSFEALKNELLQIPEVESIAALSHGPPSTGSSTNWTRATATDLATYPLGHTVSHISVDPGFLPTWNIPLIAGRNFSLDYPSELITPDIVPGQALGILLTRRGTQEFGYASPEDAVGETFRYYYDTDGRTYTVIGVVEDFYLSPTQSDRRAIAIMRGTAEPLRHVALRLRPGSGQAAIDQVAEVWKRVIPGAPFNVKFMENVISAEIEGKTQSLALAASMATLVFFCTAIIGIYAQASFVCDRNAKSIAIRKVLGSSRRSILGLLLKQFTVPVIASFALALPVSIYFIREFYSTFEDTPGFPVSLYALCLAGITLLALVTVFTHCQKAAARHPIQTLRFE